MFDCYFGSVWIFDAMAAKPVWKWCGFNSVQLQQISASQMLIINVIFYKVNDGDGHIKLQYLLSPCPGIFVHDIDLIKKLSHTITISFHRVPYLYLTQVSSRCFVVQYFGVTKQYTEMRIFGSRVHYVNEFTVIRVGKDQYFDCLDTRHIQVMGMLPGKKFGWVYLFNSQLAVDNHLWTNVSFQAMRVGIFSEIPSACSVDEGFIIAVQDTCQELVTDATFLTNVYEQPAKVLNVIRLIRGCKQFTVTAARHTTHQLSFDGSLLCNSMVVGQLFPCKAQQGILCDSIKSCAFRIEVKLKSVSSACQATKYHIQLISSSSSIQLQWSVDSSNMMSFTTSMHKQLDALGYGHLAMDIMSDGILTDEPCALEITQTIVEIQYKSLHQTVLKSGMPLSCLVKQKYIDDYKREWKTHCFKWSVSAEHIAVKDDTYIRVNSSNLTWMEAEKFCHQHDGHLVSMTSVEEEHVVASLFD